MLWSPYQLFAPDPSLGTITVGDTPAYREMSDFWNKLDTAYSSGEKMSVHRWIQCILKPRGVAVSTALCRTFFPRRIMLVIFSETFTQESVLSHGTHGIDAVQVK